LWWPDALGDPDAQAPRGAAAAYSKQIQLALQWLLAQEHQRFFLLTERGQRLGDIMPRSGSFCTQSVVYAVKFCLDGTMPPQTHANFNGLFHPFSAKLAEYRRARLLNEYVLKNGRDRDLYLSS